MNKILVPALIANQNTLIAQERNRNIVDITTTSITGVNASPPALNIPQAQMQPKPYQCFSTGNSLPMAGVLKADAYPIPGGVVFSFSRMPQNHINYKS